MATGDPHTTEFKQKATLPNPNPNPNPSPNPNPNPNPSSSSSPPYSLEEIKKMIAERRLERERRAKAKAPIKRAMTTSLDMVRGVEGSGGEWSGVGSQRSGKLLPTLVVGSHCCGIHVG